LFTRSAPYYDLLYDFKDYRAAARYVHEAIQRQNPSARRLLDVACGTGRHLEHLREWYEVEGLDINEELLAIARQRTPGVPLHVGDMVDFELDASFDVVTCLFSSIAYVKTIDRMRAAVTAMNSHLEPDGVLVIEPWFAPDSYWTGTITANFVDLPKTKIAWMYTSDEPRDGVATLDIHYLVGTPSGIEQFDECHELGLFSPEDYRAAIQDVGLSVESDPEGPFGRGLHLGHSP
jgi:ubiquinone/menaquinone biosynthesis C-methylase UbiE